LRHWSLARFLKSRVPNARRHIARFEYAAAQMARERGFDGVVCGHIHHPAITAYEGTLYCNDGDWVEHCTALVETHAGELELWHAAELQADVPAVKTDGVRLPRAA
jgi:UDP-2,3-diacylglucosamine pyrophosphatase LpxH